MKRYSNVAGVSHLGETFDPVTGKPKGDFVDSRDYDALQDALREALDKLDDYDEYPNARIAALRKEFLDE